MSTSDKPSERQGAGTGDQPTGDQPTSDRPTGDRPQKISIGFHGGQVLSARVRPSELAGLRGALGSAGWHELSAEDGIVVLDLTRVDYLLIDTEAGRVGF